MAVAGVEVVVAGVRGGGCRVAHCSAVGAWDMLLPWLPGVVPSPAGRQEARWRCCCSRLRSHSPHSFPHPDWTTSLLQEVCGDATGAYNKETAGLEIHLHAYSGLELPHYVQVGASKFGSVQVIF